MKSAPVGRSVPTITGAAGLPDPLMASASMPRPSTASRGWIFGTYARAFRASMAGILPTGQDDLLGRVQGAGPDGRHPRPGEPVKAGPSKNVRFCPVTALKVAVAMNASSTRRRTNLHTD